MILQFHDLFESILGGFLKFGPAVQRAQAGAMNWRKMMRPVRKIAPS